MQWGGWAVPEYVLLLSLAPLMEIHPNQHCKLLSSPRPLSTQLPLHTSGDA